MAASKEGKIEQYLCQKVKAAGGRAEKLAFVAKRGAPDRYCFFRGGFLFPVECKAEGGRIHPLQQLELDRLQGEGFHCFVVYSKADVDKAVEAMLKVMQNE